MKELTADIVIIGAGTAGLSAFRAARKHTNSVVLIESGPYGTTCARVGCMPSKLLISAADAAQAVKSASKFGVHLVEEARINGREVMARVRRERDRFVGFVTDSIDNSIPSQYKIKGQARFLDNYNIQVGDNLKVKAGRIVIATGSSPSFPPTFAELGERLITNDQLFQWQELPESIAVFGPGIIGLELGQALHRLGVRIRMFGRGGQVGPFLDPTIRDYATTLFDREFYLDTDAEVKKIELAGNKVRINFVDKETSKELEEKFDYLLAATGRKPNVAQLGLNKTDLNLDERSIPIFNPYTMQCGDSNIFIAGDANNDRPLLHEAADEGRIAGDNAGRFPNIRAGNRRAHLAVVFTEPQMAVVGCNYRQLTSQGTECFRTGEVSFENQGRSRVILKNKGLMHLYGEPGSGRFLGAELIAPAAEHLAHLLAWALQNKMTVSQMLEMPFYHPVIEEGLRTGLRDLNHKLKIGSAYDQRCLDCGPGV